MSVYSSMYPNDLPQNRSDHADGGPSPGGAHDSGWMDNEWYQTVLNITRTVVFEFDPAAGRQYVSPTISEYVAGNYDGRLLSDVMLEDGVIYPDDLELSLRFRDQVRAGQGGDMTLRLKTPSGEYRWFKMLLYPHKHMYVGVLTDVDAEKRQRDILRYRAEYDPTTGIYNKASFYEKTNKMLLENPDRQRCLLRFDIDRFKIINEMYSVTEGDKVLRHVGTTIKEIVTPGETYGRMGDDVFCMCVERSVAETVEMIEELEKKVNGYPLDFQIVLSAGVVAVEHYDGRPINLLCDRAAIAQRTVKGSYVQKYALYDKSMSEALSREHYITGCMRQALEEHQFIIYLQPKFNMRDNHIVGAEALVRWNHPPEGMIPPDRFIPLFERNGFILPLDEYIWDMACKTMRNWFDRGLVPVPISVNVSRIHLRDPMFCDKIQQVTEKYGISPSLLELEITESAYVESPETLYGIMDKLQDLGFLFSMDDFGSGYSSLNALKDIPVNIVKMDLNFLKESRRGDAMGHDILKGTIQLVHNMSLPIVVEGVETEEQANLLMGLGCNCAQGYYYARPMPVEEFEKLLLHEDANGGKK